MKTCTKCRATKPVTEFHRFVHAKDGLTPHCKSCRRTSNRLYRSANGDKVRAQRRTAYRANPQRAHRWRKENPERHRELQRRSSLKTLYQLTPEQYEALLLAQNGVCALCSRPSSKRLHVDHDHGCCPGIRSCGQCVRGLLCGPCNRLLGWFDNHRDAITSYLGERSVA